MSRFPWFKVWPNLVLASSRYKRLDIYQSGVYWNVMLRVNGEGALCNGDKPWDVVEDLAFDLGLDGRRTKRLVAAVDALVALDLLMWRESDGALCVSRYKRHQGPRK